MKNRPMVFSISCVLIALLSGIACAKPVCVEVNGEGAIIRGDAPSASIEALNRAKWSAVEQVAGVEVKSRTVVEDSALMDDVITARTHGVISSYRVVGEKRTDDTVQVRINACVEPVNAKTAVSALALNTSLSVYLPSRKLAKDGKGEYDDENILAQAVIGKLAEQGFSVRDLAESHALKLSDMNAALKGGDQPILRSLVYRYLSNSILIGRVEPTLSTSKGEDAGYGISMPFNTVTARLTYRLMTRDSSGKQAVLAAGSEEAKGVAPHPEDAHAEALKNLAERFTPRILEKIQARMNEIATKVTIRVDGVREPAETFAIRDILQRITWVTDVTETGLGEFRVSFPENPIYLANGMSQKGFKIVKFTPEEIRVRRK